MTRTVHELYSNEINCPRNLKHIQSKTTSTMWLGSDNRRRVSIDWPSFYISQREIPIPGCSLSFDSVIFIILVVFCILLTKYYSNSEFIFELCCSNLEFCIHIVQLYMNILLSEMPHYIFNDCEKIVSISFRLLHWPELEISWPSSSQDLVLSLWCPRVQPLRLLHWQADRSPLSHQGSLTE